MNYRLLLFPLFALFFGSLSAQDEGLRNYDWVYKNNIRSVLFHVNSLMLTQPIIDLGSSAPLELTFDDIEGGVKNYTYTVVHCNADWTPSTLAEMEYIDGFIEDRINDWRFGAKSLVPYTRYQVFLPHNDMRITKSGNYLLKVYEDERRKTLAITRRFMVVEPIVRITPRFVNPAGVGKIRTHQEIDFIVDHERIELRSPQQEIHAVVLQNGRWDNAVTAIAPMFVRRDQLVYDFQDKIVFPGGKEFRFADLRSLRSRAPGIFSIEQVGDAYEIVMERDAKRFTTPYVFYEDINGAFILETRDQRNPLSAEYVNVLFTLNSSEPYFDHELYLIGRFSDWQPKEEFRMVYNNAINAYVGKVMLKQGYYNYAYALVPIAGKDKTPDFSEVDGDWYETENEYTILIYYHPLGERYDRLIGVHTFNSNR
ncbi:MAG: DUF5103 domain-containing protein [Saprospiraceae bacterium]|nr:DUF5103 domain-containing protein [Saprospiraceae bacterium]